MGALPEIHMPPDDDLPMDDATDLAPIPEGESGALAILHRTLPAGEAITYYGKPITWDEDKVFTILHQHGMTWMSDTPQEVASMRLAAKAARGDVLVTGLGLGIFQRSVPDHVRSVTTLEMSDDVMRLTWPHVSIADERQRIVLGKAEDTMKELVRQGRDFDFIYLDTWDSGDYEQLPMVNWYIRKAGELLRDGGEVWAWTYERMVRSYIDDCMHFLARTLRPNIAMTTDRNVERIVAMFPMMGAFVVWFIDPEHEDYPDDDTCRAWLEHHARTYTMEPTLMLKLSDRRVAEQQAKELAEALATTPEDLAEAHAEYADRVLRENQRRGKGGDGSPMLCKF